MSISDAQKLSIYNGALRFIGERKLASLTENRPPRHILDDVWSDDPIDNCLEAGLWTFARRTVKLDYSPDATSDFGFLRAFEKPSDYVNTIQLSANEYFNPPLTEFSDEAGFIYCDYDEIYLGYVSNDSAYGYDVSLWTPSFRDFVHAYVGYEAFKALKYSGVASGKVNERDFMMKEMEKCKRAALGKDTYKRPPKRFPMGSWVRSRYGNFNYSDRHVED